MSYHATLLSAHRDLCHLRIYLLYPCRPEGNYPAAHDCFQMAAAASAASGDGGSVRGGGGGAAAAAAVSLSSLS